MLYYCGMVIQKDQHKELQEVGRLHNLGFIILHGSYAQGTPRVGSDLDIAIVGKKHIPFDELIEIHGELGAIFGDNRERELDLKTLQGVDPLFRYYVVRDGMLLYGDPTDFNEFKAYARRSFEDAERIFRLEGIILKKQNKLILENLAQHA